MTSGDAALVEACSLEQVPPGGAVVVELAGESIGLFNVAGRIHALRNVCPHAGAPLCLGEVTGTTESEGPYDARWVREGQILRCPWHRWEFDITTGRSVASAPVEARRYGVLVSDGTIYVDMQGRLR